MLRLWQLRTACILNNYNTQRKHEYNLRDAAALLGAIRQIIDDHEEHCLQLWLKETVEAVVADCSCLELALKLEQLADITDLTVIGTVASKQICSIRSSLVGGPKLKPKGTYENGTASVGREGRECQTQEEVKSNKIITPPFRKEHVFQTNYPKSDLKEPSSDIFKIKPRNLTVERTLFQRKRSIAQAKSRTSEVAPAMF